MSKTIMQSEQHARVQQHVVFGPIKRIEAIRDLGLGDCMLEQHQLRFLFNRGLLGVTRPLKAVLKTA